MSQILGDEWDNLKIFFKRFKFPLKKIFKSIKYMYIYFYIHIFFQENTKMHWWVQKKNIYIYNFIKNCNRSRFFIGQQIMYNDWHWKEIILLYRISAIWFHISHFFFSLLWSLIVFFLCTYEWFLIIKILKKNE